MDGALLASDSRFDSACVSSGCDATSAPRTPLKAFSTSCPRVRTWRDAIALRCVREADKEPSLIAASGIEQMLQHRLGIRADSHCASRIVHQRKQNEKTARRFATSARAALERGSRE